MEFRAILDYDDAILANITARRLPQPPTRQGCSEPQLTLIPKMRLTATALNHWDPVPHRRYKDGPSRPRRTQTDHPGTTDHCEERVQYLATTPQRHAQPRRYEAPRQLSRSVSLQCKDVRLEVDRRSPNEDMALNRADTV